MVQEPFASVLRSGRDNFNARFAEARRRYPKLDAAAFSDFIMTTLDPLVHGCPLAMGELAPLAEAGFEIGLELVGENFAGSEMRGDRLIEQAWRTIAPANWPAVASSPFHFFAAISNGVHRLSAGGNQRVEGWITAMSKLAKQCADLTTWLQVGQVLAWRAGQAEWRASALAVAGRLPEALAKAALGAPSSATWNKIRKRLDEDIWFDPSSVEASAKRTLHLVTKVGAFRGLGGRFSAPPLVATEAGQLFVRSGEQCWLLMADIFGHSFHNATIEEFEHAQSRAIVADRVRVSPALIQANALEMPNPVPGKMTSYAVLPNTVAITSSVSHAVFLIAY